MNPTQPSEIQIAIPTRGNTYWGTTEMLQHLREVTPDLPPIWYGVATLTVMHARNVLVKRFLTESTADWLLMVDDDVMPHPDVLGMFDHPDMQIVGAPYLIVRPDANIPFLCVYTKHGDQTRPIPDMFSLTGLHPCEAMGTGCMAIHRSVLADERLRAPFQLKFDADGLLIRTEDIDFCMRARAAGYTIHADFDRVADHLPAHLSLNQIHMGYQSVYTRAKEREAQAPRVVLAR